MLRRAGILAGLISALVLAPQPLLADTFNGDDNPNLFAGAAVSSTILGNGGDDTLWGDPAEAYRAVRRRIASSKADETPAAGGGDPAELGDNASFSPDGNSVAFTSDATNLVPGCCGGPQVYLKNLVNGTIQLVSSTLGGAPFYQASNPTFSSDGTAVAFSGTFTSEDFSQVWVKIIKTGELRLLSHDDEGSPGNGPSKAPAFRPKTRSVAFSSTASDLDVSDPDGAEVDVFLANIDTRAISVLLPFERTNNAADIYDLNFTPNGARYTYTYTQKPAPDKAGGSATTSALRLLQVGAQPGANLASLPSAQRIPVGGIDTDASPA
jgi:Tol biopolymer transport system component